MLDPVLPLIERFRTMAAEWRCNTASTLKVTLHVSDQDYTRFLQHVSIYHLLRLTPQMLGTKKLRLPLPGGELYITVEKEQD